MINMKSITPMFTGLVTTCNEYKEDQFDEHGVLRPGEVQGAIKWYQKVVAVGDSVRGIKVGDTVAIDISAYIKKKYSEDSLRTDIVDNPVEQVNIPTILLDNVPHYLLDVRDIKFVINDFEEVEIQHTAEELKAYRDKRAAEEARKNANLDLPKSTLILPKPGKLIM